MALKITDGTARFLLDELRRDGMFVSSLDADADGEEGLTYVWTPGQLREVLGESDGHWAAEVFSVTADGTFERGASVLQLRAEPEDVARFDRVRTALLGARSRGRSRHATTRW